MTWRPPSRRRFPAVRVDVALDGTGLDPHEPSDLDRGQLSTLDEFADQALRHVKLIGSPRIVEKGVRVRLCSRMAIHAVSVVASGRDVIIRYGTISYYGLAAFPDASTPGGTCRCRTCRPLH